ncbi:MAG: hypothetical protein HFE90_06935 [Firmicutes bacterium]|nr:hypothetical protein [Bacillota bacterium]
MEPKVTFVNQPDPYKIVKTMSELLSRRFDADIKITLTPISEVEREQNGQSA